MAAAGGAIAQAAVELAADGSKLPGSVRKAIQDAGAAAAGEAEAAGVNMGAKIGSGLTSGLAKLAGIAIAAAGIHEVISVGVEYQQTMNTLAATTHATGDQMAAAGALAQQMGRDMRYPGVTATDATKAMLDLAQAGFNIKDSMAAAGPVLNLVTASGMDTAQAAQIAGDMLDVWGLKASQAGHVADVLASAIHNTSGGLDNFYQALKYVGPVAAASGINIQDTATAVAELGKAGIIGSMAGTTLRSMLTSLSKPGQQAKDALKELGVTAYDSQGRFVGLRSVIDQLSTAHEHLTQQQFNSAVSMAFGQEAMSGVITLAEKGTAGYDKMNAALGEQGAAADLAAAKAKGLGAVMGNLQKIAADVSLQIFQAVSPALEEVGGALVNGLRNVGPMLGAVLGPLASVFGRLATLAAGALAPTLALLQPLFAGVAAGARFLVDALNNPVVAAFVVALASVAAAMTAASLATKLWASVTGLATKAMGLLTAVMDANPIVLIALAIVGLVAGFIYLWNTSAAFRGFWIGLWSGITSVFQAVVGWIVGAFNTIVGWFQKLPAAALLLLGPLGAVILVLTHLPQVIGFVVAAGKGIIDFFVNLPSMIGSGLSALGGMIATGFTTAVAFFASLPGRIGAFLAPLPGVLGSELLAALRFGATAVVQGLEWIIAEIIVFPAQVALLLANLGIILWNAFTAAWRMAVNATMAAGQAILNWVIGLPGQIANAMFALGGLLVNAAIAAWNWYVSTTTTVALAVVNWVVNLPSMIANGLLSLGGLLVNAAVSAWNWWVSTSISIGMSILSWVTGLPGQILSGLGALGGMLAGAAQAAWNWFVSATESAAEGVFGFVQSIPGRILGFLSGLGSLLVGVGESIINGLLNGLKSAVGGIWDFVSGIGDKIKSLKGPLPYDRQLLIPAGQEIMGGLDRGLRGGFTQVRSTLRGFTKELPNFTVPVQTTTSTGAWRPPEMAAAARTAAAFTAATGGRPTREVHVHAPLTVQPREADPVLVARRAVDHVAALAQG